MAATSLRFRACTWNLWGIPHVATATVRRRLDLLASLAVRHAIRINGIAKFALTKLDVLEGLDPIKICVAYKVNGKRVSDFPAGRAAQMKIEPIYKNYKGFKGNLREMKDYKKWPKEARDFVAAIEGEIGAKAALISLGKSRDETIVLDKTVSWLK